jgi:chemotaxis signal transduction protein
MADPCDRCKADDRITEPQEAVACVRGELLCLPHMREALQEGVPGAERLGYVVIDYADGKRPWVGFLIGSLKDARECRDESARVSKTARRNERHVLAEVFEVPE